MTISHPAPTDARVEERAAVDAATFAAEIALRDAPIVLRGQVAHWASVRAAAGGDRATAAYLTGLGNGGKPMEVLIGGPASVANSSIAAIIWKGSTSTAKRRRSACC